MGSILSIRLLVHSASAIYSYHTIQDIIMAPVEIDHVPRSIIAPVKNMKVVDKAMALPLVSSAYSEVSRVTSPYVESTLNKVTPMMETTWSKVTETVQTVQTAAVDNITAAVEKVDTFACGGI